MGPGDPLMKRIRIEESEKDFYVIGVIKDFHFQPLTQTIKPLILTSVESNFITLYAKIKKEEMAETIAFIRNTTNEFDPDRVPSIRILDERMLDVYRDEQGQSTLLLAFAGLAVLVACLGLFGLASFTAERKTKEIGIRKILGAETERIFFMLSKDFAVLSLFSVAIGCPFSVYFVSRWMQNFAYHVPILPWTFLLTGLLVLVIMILTAGTQIIRITRINPVEVLKFE
jgi:putative ABC transport system permease protein